MRDGDFISKSIKESFSSISVPEMNNPSDNEAHLSNLVDKSRSKSRKMPLRIPIHQIDMAHSRQAPLKEVVLVTRGSTTIPTQQLEPTSPVDSSFYLR